MLILWDRKCEYWLFHITHAKNLSNHESLTRDLTRFFWHLWCGKSHTHISSSQYSLIVHIMYKQDPKFKTTDVVYCVAPQWVYCHRVWERPHVDLTMKISHYYTSAFTIGWNFHWRIISLFMTVLCLFGNIWLQIGLITNQFGAYHTED